MTRGELEDRLARDHARLRGKSAVLRSLALGFLRGDADLAETLVLKGRDLQQSLIEHMNWEEDVLVPNLRRASPEASRVAERIHDEHRGQRVQLVRSIRDLSVKPSPAPGAGDETAGMEDVAREFLELTERLERDMATEESTLGALPG